MSRIRHAALCWPSAGLPARLAAEDAVVCTASLLGGAGELERALEPLSPAERDRHESYANAVVARRFAIGRATLRAILGDVLAMAPGRIPLVEGLHGKPALARGASPCPLWFSVAHSEDLVVVALSRTADVGIDVERQRAIEQWERVAGRVLDPAERAQLRRAVDAGEEAGTAFLRHWCRVEAELKAIGCGIAGLEEHRAGRRPMGLRVAELNDLPLPPAIAATGVRYQAALALCAPEAERTRQSALASSQAATPSPAPARESTA